MCQEAPKRQTGFSLLRILTAASEFLAFPPSVGYNCAKTFRPLCLIGDAHVANLYKVVSSAKRC